MGPQLQHQSLVLPGPPYLLKDTCRQYSGGLPVEGLQLPGFIGGLPFEDAYRGPRLPTIRRLAASRGHRRTPFGIIGSEHRLAGKNRISYEPGKVD